MAKLTGVMQGIMDITVFDTFTLSEYTFLEIERGTVAGDIIVSETIAEGVFKLRTGFISADNQETRQADATLHIRPSEGFIEANGGNLVGHGVRVEDVDYEITGVTAGDNYETGEREHYRVTLNVTNYSDWESS